MLIEFKFNNYSSFRDETILDMSAAEGITDYPHHVVSCGDEEILKTAAVYGANASGKTNLYRAFKCMKNYVLSSINYGGSTSQSERVPYLLPYLLDEQSKNADSVFEVWYYDERDKKTYNYGFSAGNKGVSEEWLNVKIKSSSKYRQIFYRNEGKSIDFGNGGKSEASAKRPRGIIPKSDRAYLSRALNKETLLLSLGAKVKVPILERVLRWFEKLVFLDFGTPGENYLLSSKMPNKFADDAAVQNSVVDYFSSFDTAIKGFRVERAKETEQNDSQKGYYIWAKHRANDSDNFVELPMGYESAGTQKMFAMYDALQDVLQCGGVLIIDELNDRLHPLLVRDVIQTFFDTERNPNNAQLIITTHDVIQLATDLFRRDEIWFVEKEEDGASHLYSLADFPADDSQVYSPPDGALWYQYLLGKYGAIPELKKILISTGNDDNDDNYDDNAGEIR